MNNRGSVTIFFSMVLLVVISVVCAALETARYSCISCILSMASYSAADSVFAGYDRLLWDKYRLLLYPYPNRIEAQAEDYAGSSLGCGRNSSVWNRWGIKDISVSVESKVSVYENGGQPFLDSVSAYMKYQKNDMNSERYKRDEEFIRAAMQAGEQFQELIDGSKQELIYLAETSQKDRSVAAYGYEDSSNITEYISKSAFSEMVIYSSLSTNYINSAELSSSIMSGNEDILRYTEQDMEFLYQYIAMFLDSYTCHGAGSPIVMYQQEYVLCGLPSDKDNLEETINQLIRLRGGINYDYICSSPNMLTEVYQAAEVLVQKSEEIEEAEKFIGMLWVYAETVNDVKNLLNGKMVQLVKDSSSWKLSIEDMLSGNWEAECEDEGLNYQEYLQLLLRLQPENGVCVRTMDIIDSNMRLSEKDFLLADCIYKACLKLEFSVDSGYISIPALTGISGKAISEYRITKICDGGYD